MRPPSALPRLHGARAAISSFAGEAAGGPVHGDGAVRVPIAVAGVLPAVVLGARGAGDFLLFLSLKQSYVGT